MKRLVALAWGCCVACAKPVPPAPAPAPQPPPRYGPIMVAVGHHHELLGRAIAAERWELAAFALRELDEDLEPLSRAEQPEEARAPLAPLAEPFARTQLSPVVAAVSSHDVVAARRAWAAVSDACNGCHTTGGFGFLVVPMEAGSAVPEVTPAHAPDAGTPDATTDVPAEDVVDAAPDARRLPGMYGDCDDRVGCARGLMCCTHGGIEAPPTHHGRCMTFRMCNTQP